MLDDPEDLANDYAAQIICAAYIYYHTEKESPYSDQEYDAMVDYVSKNKGLVDSTLLEILGEFESTGMHILKDL